MKTPARISLLLAGGLAVAAVQADTTRRYTDENGHLIECTQQEVTTTKTPQSGGNHTLGTVAGGVIGGVAGNQIGSGSGNTAATVAGAVGGAVVGNKIAKDRAQNPKSETVVEERCVRVD